MAEEKREESLKYFKTKISDRKMCKICCEQFQKHVNEILDATEKKVKNFAKSLGLTVSLVGITIGAVVAAVLTPPTVLISPVAATVGSGFLASTYRSIRSGFKIKNALEAGLEEKLDVKTQKNGKTVVIFQYDIEPLKIEKAETRK